MPEGLRFGSGGGKRNDPEAMRKMMDKKAAAEHPFLKGGQATTVEPRSREYQSKTGIDQLMAQARTLETKGNLTESEQQELEGLQGRIAAYHRNEREQASGSGESLAA